MKTNKVPELYSFADLKDLLLLGIKKENLLSFNILETCIIKHSIE